jgi:hypothetical protein
VILGKTIMSPVFFAPPGQYHTARVIQSYLLQQWNMHRRLIAILAAGLAVIVISAVALNRYVDETYRNYSALSVTERFLKSHLREGPEPNFPESWANIADEYNAFCDKNQTSLSLTELQRRVTINWSVGKECLQDPTATEEQSAIITLADGSTMRWHGDDPNANIIRFMKQLKRTATGK